ncbi:uncharacterized protein BDW43DRAFT_264625 [Aspergillus alliaceus]|uniref:uncharacterized protein n=1 Tax=Petromyces alliaceus TaxID=209559 RepID=UPI0012A3C378|nr:uncharacterized protein BDW43DRAFT_264625 [Aspergillus alliaceus]KAB8237100.1 hypothetical protein BDW43DRAFT_264625 [Aspergillus alliaceus]
MSSLSWRLGLSTPLSFTDVFSIDEPDLLAMIPAPCYGVLLVFPINEAYGASRIQEDEGMEDYNGSGEEETAWLKFAL